MVPVSASFRHDLMKGDTMDQNTANGGERIFTDKEATLLDDSMLKAEEICEEVNSDIYNECIESSARVGQFPIAWQQETDDMQKYDLARGRSICCTHGLTLEDATVHEWELTISDEYGNDLAPAKYFESEETAKAAAPAYLRAHSIPEE